MKKNIDHNYNNSDMKRQNRKINGKGHLKTEEPNSRKTSEQTGRSMLKGNASREARLGKPQLNQKIYFLFIFYLTCEHMPGRMCAMPLQKSAEDIRPLELLLHRL